MSAGSSAYARYLWLSLTLRRNQARRWRIGAAAEFATSRLNRPLKKEGWHFLYDRALPRSKANLDGLAIPPCGSALVIQETKRWPADSVVALSSEGELMCGNRRQGRDVDSLLHEVARVNAASHVPVIPVIAVCGASVSGGRMTEPFRCRRTGRTVYIHIVEARRLTEALRVLNRESPCRKRASQLNTWAKRVFPHRAPWPARVLAHLFLRIRG